MLRKEVALEAGCPASPMLTERFVQEIEIVWSGRNFSAEKKMDL